MASYLKLSSSDVLLRALNIDGNEMSNAHKVHMSINTALIVLHIVYVYVYEKFFIQFLRKMRNNNEND